MRTRDQQARDLSVIIPTYNEAENLPILVGKLESVLDTIDYEIIVVDDDSPDKTWQLAEDLGRQNKRVRCIRRLDAKGLSSAVTAGMLASTGNTIAVMDADMQHDEAILPKMHEIVAGGECDVCVGSREAEGGSYGEWSASRKFVSASAKALAHIALGPSVRDPMSGFFAISRPYFESTVNRVNPSGFKILLEFIARGESPRVQEVGYTFRNRVYGETKLNATIAVEYLLALIDLRFGWLIPNRFVKFGMVGVSGSLVNFCGFAVAQALGVSVPMSVYTGVQLAIIWTYFGNNVFTFSPLRYRGASFFKGLVLYQVMSVYGLVVQMSIVDSILSNWPVLGESIWTLYAAYLIGVAFAAIGNYFIHAYYTWNRLGFTMLRPVKS